MKPWQQRRKADIDGDAVTFRLMSFGQPRWALVASCDTRGCVAFETPATHELLSEYSQRELAAIWMLARHGRKAAGVKPMPL